MSKILDKIIKETERIKEINLLVNNLNLVMDHKIKVWNLEKAIQMDLQKVKTQIIKKEKANI